MSMPLYEKRDDACCGGCGHFIRHYIWYHTQFTPLSVGHCTFPRVKDRQEGRSCPLWVPAEPGHNPPCPAEKGR